MLPKIAILKKHPQGRNISDDVDAFIHLEELDGKVIDLSKKYINPDTQLVDEELLGQCDALICRPLWGGQISLDLITKLRRQSTDGGKNTKFSLATLSASVSHIPDEMRGDRNIKIISSNGGNAGSTAETTVFIALALRRRFHSNINKMAFGSNHRGYPKEPIHSLRNTTWTLLGRGNVARNVVKRTIGFGLSRIIVWNHKMSLKLFCEMFEDLNIVSWVSRDDSHPCAIIGAQGAGPSCLIEGTMVLENALRDADIVSIHLDLKKNHALTRKGGTKDLIDADKIRLMKKNAILINIGRDGIVVNRDILDALAKGNILGYGCDVLDKSSEDRQSTPLQSHNLLWQAYCYNQILQLTVLEEIHFANLRQYMLDIAPDYLTFMRENGFDESSYLNILVTPHIGGRSLDAEDSIATEVLGKLLIDLGKEEYVDFYTPEENIVGQYDIHYQHGERPWKNLICRLQKVSKRL